MDADLSVKNETIKIAMVGYLNTLPFVYGLEHAGLDENLLLDIPARCIEHFDQGTADIALVPLGAVIERSNVRIITNYCIGCDGAVRTVCLFSHTPIKDLHTIYLDTDSRTSVLLVRILMKAYADHPISYHPLPKTDRYSEDLEEGAGVLLIGDKVFEAEKQFKHKLDLGAAWKDQHQLPFVFAVWIAKDHVSDEVIQKLNAALHYGIDHVDDVISKYGDEYADLDLRTYFTKYISYELGDGKKRAIDTFKKIMNQRELVDL